MIISSERLDLLPMTPAFLRASLLRDQDEAARLLGVAVPEDWPDGVENLLEMRLADLEATPSLQPWLLRAIVLRETGAMVGYGGFHTAPAAAYLASFSPQAVEMGWTILPAFRRRGYARETALALMHWARHHHHISEFILTISPENLASQALAAELGFVVIGSHIDEVDGLEEVYERRFPVETEAVRKSGARIAASLTAG